MKVRCIEYGVPYLTHGKEYEVISSTPKFYTLKNDKGFVDYYYKNRFEVIPESGHKGYHVGDRVIRLQNWRGSNGFTKEYKNIEIIKGTLGTVTVAGTNSFVVRWDTGDFQTNIAMECIQKHVEPEPKEKENTVKITLSKPEVTYNPGDVYKCRCKSNSLVEYLLVVKNIKLANSGQNIRFVNILTGNPADLPDALLSKYELVNIGRLDIE